MRRSLVAAGQLDDPLAFAQAAASNWVADRDWWYRTTVPAVDANRAFLIFDGVDYRADYWLNGQLIGRHEGMFSQHRFEVPVTGGDLLIRLRAPSSLPKPTLSRWDRLAAALLRRTVGGEFFPDRLGTLKCQMTFGWDFAPALPTVGIWDDVWLRPTGPVAITDLAVRARPAGSGAVVDVAITLDGAGLVRVSVGDVTAERWIQTSGHLRLDLDTVDRWHPWERGEAAQVDLTADVIVDGGASDSRSTSFGVRTVTMARAEDGRRPGAPVEDAVGLVINGEAVPIRGANWVPTNSLLGPVDYRLRIQAAKEAGINLLRVWGGGLRERQAFYRVCDSLGMLVWQEFPFSVAFFDHFPRDPAYLAIVASEAAGIVRAVRDHPSVVVYCGGNEFSPSRNRPVVDRLAQAVSRHDGTRPFRAASPAAGERHNWRVWHGWANVADYRLETQPLLSEFGLQAMPDPATVAESIGDAWEEHSAQIGKLVRYAQVNPADPAFIAASQRAQANALQVAIEHQRRRWPAATGTILWQLNEPWPAISWSIVDGAGRPKEAFRRLRHWYAPLLVSINYPLRRYTAGDRLDADLWLTGSGRGDAIVIVESAGSEIARLPVRLPEGRSKRVRRLRVRLPAAEIALRVKVAGETVTENWYDLGWHDPEPTSLYHIVRDWITWCVLH